MISYKKVQDVINRENKTGQQSSAVDTRGKALASCWRGAGAAQRMMNILSPHMANSVANEYINWMAGRGCNTAHVILCNEGDGEYAGYCPYGTAWTGNANPPTIMSMLARMSKIKAAGMNIVVWIFADDGPTFNRKTDAEYVKLFNTCATVGFFARSEHISLGIEVNEYFSKSRVQGLADNLRRFGKPIAIHQTSDRTDYASAADIFYFQMNPGASASKVESAVRSAASKVGKPLVAFELARTENRGLCEAAFRGGAIGVGNW